jgi:hypothetical protein
MVRGPHSPQPRIRSARRCCFVVVVRCQAVLPFIFAAAVIVPFLLCLGHHNLCATVSAFQAAVTTTAAARSSRSRRQLPTTTPQPPAPPAAGSSKVLPLAYSASAAAASVTVPLLDPAWNSVVPAAVTASGGASSSESESSSPKVGVLLLNLGGPETGDDVEGAYACVDAQVDSTPIASSRSSCYRCCCRLWRMAYCVIVHFK